MPHVMLYINAHLCALFNFFDLIFLGNYISVSLYSSEWFVVGLFQVAQVLHGNSILI